MRDGRSCKGTTRALAAREACSHRHQVCARGQHHQVCGFAHCVFTHLSPHARPASCQQRRAKLALGRGGKRIRAGTTAATLDRERRAQRGQEASRRGGWQRWATEQDSACDPYRFARGCKTGRPTVQGERGGRMCTTVTVCGTCMGIRLRAWRVACGGVRRTLSRGHTRRRQLTQHFPLPFPILLLPFSTNPKPEHASQVCAIL